MRMRRWLAVSLGLVTAFAFVAPSSADNPILRNKYEDTTATRQCGNGDTVVYGGPLKMWPPNHKLQNVTVTATDGGNDGGSEATLTVTPQVTDAAGGDGGPNHDPDYSPGNLTDTGDPAVVDFWLRSERSGKGVGRTYTIEWVAVFDGQECSSADEDQEPFIVTVPHDMRGGAGWK